MQDPKQIMEQGWKARESLDFDTADKLLNQAKDIFEKNEDWFNFTECLNHLAYTHKLLASLELDKGLRLLNDAKKVAKEKTTKDILILRASMSLLDAKGNYEKAKIIAEQLLEKAEKPNMKADLLSHLATFNLRTGNVDKAKELIEQADEFMQNSEDIEKDPVKSIWKCKILLTKALIEYNSQNFELARELAEKALVLADEKDLKTRSNQAEELLELLNPKN